MLATLAALCLTSPLAQPGDGSVVSPLQPRHFVDQGHVIEVLPHHGSKVWLRWPDGLNVPAEVTPHSILTLPEAPSQAWLDQHHLRLTETLSERLGLYRVISTQSFEDGVALTIRLQAAHLEAYPDFIFAKEGAAPLPPQTVTVNDPRRSAQWYLDRIEVARAWTFTMGNPEVRIGVVDNGCDYEHPDLAAHLYEGTDLVDNDNDASFEANDPGNEHGTACAGIIAAVGNNQEGIAGVCPTCTMSCVRLLAPEGRNTPLSSDVKAFTWQLEQNISVSSNSWGYVSPTPVSSPLKRALEALIREGRQGLGTIVVFAAGNSDRTLRDDELYHIDGLLTIGAINRNDETTPYTNRGKWIDIVAPLGTFTTDISGPDGASADNYTNHFGGTSSAAPVVAGVAALLVAVAPEKTGYELAELLVNTASPAYYAVPDANGHDELFGYGVVNPVGALLALVPPTEPPEPGTDTDTDTDDAPPSPQTKDSGCQGGGLGFLALTSLPLLAWRRRAQRSQELS